VGVSEGGLRRKEWGGTILRGGFASAQWKLGRRFGGASRRWVGLVVGASDSGTQQAQLSVELSFAHGHCGCLAGREPRRDSAFRKHERPPYKIPPVQCN